MSDYNRPLPGCSNDDPDNTKLKILRLSAEHNYWTKEDGSDLTKYEKDEECLRKKKS